MAHSVNAYDQVAVGIILSGFEEDATVEDVARIRLRKSKRVSFDEAAKLEDLIRSVRQHVEKMNDEAYRRLLDRAKATPVSELQKCPELSVTSPATDLRSIITRRK